MPQNFYSPSSSSSIASKIWPSRSRMKKERGTNRKLVRSSCVCVYNSQYSQQQQTSSHSRVVQSQSQISWNRRQESRNSSDRKRYFAPTTYEQLCRASTALKRKKERKKEVAVAAKFGAWFGQLQYKTGWLGVKVHTYVSGGHEIGSRLGSVSVLAGSCPFSYGTCWELVQDVKP